MPAGDKFNESRKLMISILDNTLRQLKSIKKVQGDSPYGRMQDERRADQELRTVLETLGRTLGQQYETRNILSQLVSAIEIRRGERAKSTALKLENEIHVHFSQYDPKQLGFTLEVDLRDIMDRERAEKRSNPFW